MNFRRLGASLSLAAAVMLAASPAFADGYQVRDGQGQLQTMASKLLGAVNYPIHLLYGLFAGTTPTPVNVDASGNVGVNVQSSALPSGASTSANQATANTSLNSIDTKTPALGSAAKAASTPVVLPTDPDTRNASANITAADIASTTVAGQGGVTLVNGTPTANSAVIWTLNGHSSLTIQASGTFVATAPIEVSADCVLYAPATSAKIRGTGTTVASITAPGVFSVDVTGMACARVRATAYTSGTLAVLANASAASGLMAVLSPAPLRGADGATAASTSNPVPVGNQVAASTNGSGTVTTGGTYQTVFAANTSRKGCTIQNPTTATEVLNVRTGGAIVWTVPIGGTFSCGFPGGVVSDLIEVTAATSTHAFTAAQQ